MTGAERDARWERLFELLGPVHARAMAFARRLSRSFPDGDDLYQEAVLRAFSKLDTLRQPERFRPWFYTVVLSVHRNRSRRGFWRRFIPLDEPGEGEAGHAAAPASDPTADWDRARRMSGALATLPAVQREAVVLHELEGFALEEIAEIQGASLSAVKTRVSRGRERLRRHYERLGHSPIARLREKSALG